MGDRSLRVKKRNQRDYNLGFKLSVISQIEKGEMTYKQAQRVYSIQGWSTFLVWVNGYLRDHLGTVRLGWRSSGIKRRWSGFMLLD